MLTSKARRASTSTSNAPWEYRQETRPRAKRRAATLLAFAPLTFVLAYKLFNRQPDLLMAYGTGVFASTMAVMYLAFVHYKDPSCNPPHPDAEVNPLVSFMVAVKDDVAVIESCVTSMLAQDYANLEVIVVDDGSTDGTGDVLAELAANPRLRVITMPKNVGKKRALVEAARVANGSLLAFTDSDSIIEPCAITRCVRAFAAEPGLGGVSGHARALNSDYSWLTASQDVWYDGQFGVAKAAETVFGAVTCVSGPLAVFRREAILNYLPAWANDRFLGREFRFATDRQLTGYVLCQLDVGARLKLEHRGDPLVDNVDYVPRSWKVRYVRSARAWTNVPSTRQSFMRQQLRWKKSFIRNLCFTGKYYWRRAPLAAPLFYAHVIWVIVAPFMVAWHLIWLPLHAAFVPTLIYMCGVALKGCVWGLAYRIQNPGDRRWRYRPVMSLVSLFLLSWLLPIAAVTVRRGTWRRPTADLGPSALAWVESTHATNHARAERTSK